MLKKYFAMFLLGLVISLPVYSYASGFSEIKVEKSRAEEKLIINGRTSSGRSGVQVSAMVISRCPVNEDATTEEIDKAYLDRIKDIAEKKEGYYDKVTFAGQAVTADQGRFSLPLQIAGDSGLYLVRVTSGDGNGIYSEYIQFYTAEYVDEVVKKINKSTEISQIKEILDAEVYNQDMESELYTAAKSVDMTLFYNKILNADDFASFDEFEKYYTYTLAAFALESGKKELYETALENYSEMLEINRYKVYNSYINTFNDTLKNRTMERVRSEVGTDEGKRFAHAAFMAGFENLSLWTQVSDYIKTNAADLTDLSHYGASTDDIDKALVKLDAGNMTFDDFEKKFKNIISQNTGKPSGAGGGGGGASGSNMSFGSAASTDNSQNAEPKKKTYFTDIDTVPWAEEAIISLAEKGIINGVGNAEFAPDELVTREQFITMLINCMGIEAADNIAMDFMDVKTNDWYYPSVLAAYAAGIVKGKSDGSMGIGETITRQDIAVMAARAFEMSDNSDVPFKDSDSISAYATAGVSAMCKAGIINGFEDNTFRPLNYATRAEAAQIVYGLSCLH